MRDVQTPVPNDQTAPLQSVAAQPCPFRATLVISLGATIGMDARYGATLIGQHLAAMTFPITILLVNLIGCLLIGVVQTLVLQRRLAREAQLFAVVGVLGGFTTFSTLSVDTLRLLQSRRIAQAALYQTGSLVGGVVAVVAGRSIALWIVRVRRAVDR